MCAAVISMMGITVNACKLVPAGVLLSVKGDDGIDSSAVDAPAINQMLKVEMEGNKAICRRLLVATIGDLPNN